jgi:methionyl-tRNA formyltransferase
VVFIGCVESSQVALGALMDVPGVELVGVVTRQASSFNADFVSLQPQAEKHGCPLMLVDEAGQDAVTDWVRERSPDVVFCIGWSFLLPAELLAIPRLGTIGYHPAALPRNRGRHPLIWALALGLSETASTFFLMDEGVDSGDIVSQEVLPIDKDDDARRLYDKAMAAIARQVPRIARALLEDRLEARPQDTSKANYWRKRGAVDGLIDWRMPATGIHNLVRALNRPYPGADCRFRGDTAKVWKVRPVSESRRNLEPGKVLDRDGRMLTVKCGEDAVQLLEHELEPLPEIGEYL